MNKSRVYVVWLIALFLAVVVAIPATAASVSVVTKERLKAGWKTEVSSFLMPGRAGTGHHRNLKSKGHIGSTQANWIPGNPNLPRIKKSFFTAHEPTNIPAPVWRASFKRTDLPTSMP